jgi:hypothetical protein
MGVCLQVHLLGKHIGKEADEIERVIARPTYFNPYEAVDFGIIDSVRMHPAELTDSTLERQNISYLHLHPALHAHVRHAHVRTD